MFQSGLKVNDSKTWESWTTNVWTTILNDGFKLKEKIKNVEPESVTCDQNEFKYNAIDGYENNEIPIGCAKQLVATVLPNNTSNKSVSFTAYPSDKVNLVQNNNTVTIEALKLGEVTIKVKSNINNSLESQYTYTIVDKVAPTNFSLLEENLAIKKGQSLLIDVKNANEQVDNDIMAMRYYDFSKLSFSSSNESVVSIRKPYIKALETGTSIITVSNGTITKQINVVVEEATGVTNSATSLDVIGNNTVKIMSVDKNEFTKLTIDWGENAPTDQNVIWSVDNPAAAIVTNDGKVMGYRKIDSENDIDFTIRATSVDDPNLYKDFPMKSCHTVPSKIDLITSMALDNNGNRVLNTGKNSTISIDFGDEIVTKTAFEVSNSNSDVVSVYAHTNDISVYGLKEGQTTLVVTSKIDNTIKSNEFKINVVTRKYINEDNKADFSFLIRKYISGHAFLFMVASVFMALYLFFAHKDKPQKIMILAVISSIGVSFVMACISEFIQLFVPGRVGAWSDIGIDMLGSGVGVILILIAIGIYLMSKKHKEKAKNNNSVNERLAK